MLVAAAAAAYPGSSSSLLLLMMLFQKPRVYLDPKQPKQRCRGGGASLLPSSSRPPSPSSMTSSGRRRCCCSRTEKGNDRNRADPTSFLKGLGYDQCEADSNEKKEAGANIVVVVVVVVVCCCFRSIPRPPDPSLLDRATHPRGLPLSLIVLITGYEGRWCRRGHGAAAGRLPRPSWIGSTGCCHVDEHHHRGSLVGVRYDVTSVTFLSHVTIISPMGATYVDDIG
jgi:hypothetical protein